jgi:hypothetical protein
MPDLPGVPRDRDAQPSLDEVLALRADRMAIVRQVLADLTDETAGGMTEPAAEPGYPEPESFAVRRCLQAIPRGIGAQASRRTRPRPARGPLVLIPGSQHLWAGRGWLSREASLPAAARFVASCSLMRLTTALSASTRCDRPRWRPSSRNW